MLYALIYNNKIMVGPRSWNYSFFKRFLDDNTLDSTNLPISDPGAEFVGVNYQIVPVELQSEPTYTPPFEQLAGPYLTINSNSVVGYYTVANCNIDSIKSALMQTVVSNRYTVEVMGCNYTFPDGNTVTLSTDRINRNMYLQASQLIPDSTTQILYKFSNNYFRLVTKSDMANVSLAVASWVQSSFDWEANVSSQISAANTVSELTTITTTNPNQITNRITPV